MQFTDDFNCSVSRNYFNFVVPIFVFRSTDATNSAFPTNNNKHNYLVADAFWGRRQDETGASTSTVECVKILIKRKSYAAFMFRPMCGFS
jgi:hypothetical protein